MAVDRQTLIVIAVSVIGPVLGSAIGVLMPARRRTMLLMLAFAAGTMLAISFLELIPEAVAACGFGGCAAGIAIGVCAMLLLGDVIPGSGDPSGQYKRTSLLLLAAITLHNFPEGLAMAGGEAASGCGSALLIATAIAAHDVPEGVCTAAPYYIATGNRARAFCLSSATCVPTVAGYLAGRLLFRQVGSFAAGMLSAAIAGLMIYISCDELLPAAQSAGGRRAPAVSLFLGVLFVMALQRLIG